MATEVVKIVDTGGGGDYSSLAAWEAGEQRDLVTADEIAVADCRCSTGAADTDLVKIIGWVTDADHYIKIWTDPDQGYRHDGKWNTNAYRMETSSDFCIYPRENYVWIDGLQLQTSSTAVYNTSSYDVDGLKVSNCVIDAANGIYINNPPATVKVWNCVIYGTMASGSEGIYCYNVGNFYIYNCTIYNFDDGIERDSGTCIVRNCAVFNNHDDFDGVTDIEYCASDDGDGTNAVIPSNWDDVFVDIANRDFHLKSTDTDLRNAGTDLSSDPNLAFTDDIDGETRSGAWDIGADEYVAGGTTVTGSANIQSASSTSSATLAVLRALSANVQSQSDTSTVALDVLRSLSASIQAQSNTATPQLNLLLAAIADIQAATNTSAITLALLKTALANITSQTSTSTALLNILRSVTADIQAQTYAADDVDLTVAGLITAIANILAATNTSTIDLAVLRTLSAAINAQSFASDSVELSIAGLVQAIANIAAQTSTPDAALVVLRPVTADIQAQSATSAVTLGLIYSLTASIQAATATPDDIDLVLIKIGQAQITVTTQTAQTALTILRSLSASIQAGTTTSDALLAVLRTATAQMDATTLTSAINLITAGLGLIVGTTIESLTVGRTLTSLTPERTFTSLTPERTIEEV